MSTINATWVGAQAYTPPYATLAAWWDTSVFVAAPAGLQPGGVGFTFVTKQQFISPGGFSGSAVGTLLATLNWQYIPPYATISVRWAGAATYAPPAGTISASWVVAPPAVDQYLYPTSSGFSSSQVGDHVLRNAVDYLLPTGVSPFASGTPTIVLVAQGVSVGGIAPPPQTGPNGDRQIPSPFIDFRIRYLTPGGIAIPTNQIATTHVIAFDIQYIDLAGRGPNPWVTGNARIEYAVRYIEPPFIASNIFGSHNVARIQVVAPTGWESSFISENHEFDINLQRVFHHSGEADPTGYGATHIRNQFEVLRPTGWLSQNINFPIVYNLDQYLFVQPYMGTNSDPTQWPPYSPFVENKTRTLGPGGWQSSRFSVIGNIVENTAAPLLPPGLDATIWGPETFIAHRIRYVGPEGWDSFYNTQYTVIYNNAAVLAPQGWDNAQVGTPEQVINLNRTVKHVFPYGGETVGTAFIAPAVRTVFPGLFYDVPSGFPEARLNPYPIAAVGVAPPQFGGHTVYEHFTTAYPRSTNVHAVPWVGEPIIENRNKTLSVFPSEQSLYGLSVVANYNTYLGAVGSTLTQWGAHYVGRRTRVIVVAPASTPNIYVTHVVRNDSPDPPSTQRALPDGIFVGREDLPGIVSTPAINLATLFPIGVSPGVFGISTLSRNTIELQRSIFDLDQCGTPTLSATQYVYPNTLPWPNLIPPYADSDKQWGAIAVSPHTIYAPSADQATEQAKKNHPPNTPHVIGGREPNDEWSGGGFPWFGHSDVSNHLRAIYPIGMILGGPWSSRVGDPSVSLKNRSIYPITIRATRFGLTMFLGVEQRVSLVSHGFLSGEIGDAIITRPAAEPQLLVSGFDMSVFGGTRVELFIRALPVEGIPHRGNPQQNLTNPWGLPLVGYPRRYTLGGEVFTLWGAAWVSHKNRTLPVQGWNSLTLEDEDIDSFSERMRVSRRNPDDGLPGIAPTSVVGRPTVTHSTRYVIGRGVAGYAAGLPSLQSKRYLRPPGWASSVIGDVDRWEAGKIKAYGGELGGVGYPRLLHPIRPSSADSFASGMHAAGRRVSVAGLPPIGFAGPSISNPFGCNTRVVVPLPILSQQNVPIPAVTR